MSAGGVREHESEPVRGLPERLPAGERLLWQGSPDWKALARRAFHVRKIALYCGILLAWRVTADLWDGVAAGTMIASVASLLPLALAAVALPTLLAWLFARSTVYTVTSRRVVMRFGVAFPMVLNLPFKVVGDAGLKTYADGTGDLPLALTGRDQIGYLHLWPHARPWRFAPAEPMLRAVPDAARVGAILAEALTAAAAPAAEPGLAAAASRVRVRERVAA